MLGNLLISVCGRNLAACIRTRKSGIEANCTQYMDSDSCRTSGSRRRSASRIRAPSREVFAMQEYFSQGRSGKIPIVIADSRSE